MIVQLAGSPFLLVAFTSFFVIVLFLWRSRVVTVEVVKRIIDFHVLSIFVAVNCCVR